MTNTKIVLWNPAKILIILWNLPLITLQNLHVSQNTLTFKIYKNSFNEISMWYLRMCVHVNINGIDHFILYINILKVEIEKRFVHAKKKYQEIFKF